MTDSGSATPSGPPQGYPPQGYPPQAYPPQGYPPQGYPPQAYPPYGGGPGPQSATRTAIPKVLGILMIIFGSIGLLSALINLATGSIGFGMQTNEFARRAQQELASYSRTTSLIGLPIALLQLIAGIWALRYKRGAQMIASTYAALAIINVIVGAILMFSWFMPVLDKSLPPRMAEQMKSVFIGAFVFGSLLGMVWPALVLILMNRRTAREACVN